MYKIKYILKRIKNVQWKNMIQVARKVSKKVHKPTIVILFDMIRCVSLYGAGYMDYFEFEFFLLNKEERKTFLTAALNNQIIAKYNLKENRNKFSDKILFNTIFKNYLNHDFIDLNHSSLKEFQAFCQNKKEIVGKVVDSCGGKGIDIYCLKEFDIQELYDLLIQKKQFLVEEKIEQDEKMNSLYAKSINTLRIISFLTDDNEVVILNTVLRIGNGGVVDNFSSGGIYTFVSDEGKVLIPAIDEEGNIYENHPVTETQIVGFEIPRFEEIKNFVKEISLVEPTIRYVGWDIAVGKDKPILIEGNEFSGVFQMKPSLSHKKEGLLPKYKKYMDL